MSAIARVHARQVLDSRGNPTVEVDVQLASGAGGHVSAWLLTALVAAIGIRAVFRSQRFDPDRYRARRR